MTTLTALIPLAPGAEEIETITVADLLIRAGVRVTLASTTSAPVIAGSRGIALGAHTLLERLPAQTFDLIYLPGGKGSAEVCRDDARIQDLAQAQLAAGRLLAVICAAPQALIPRALCAGRKLTSHPSVRALVEPHCTTWLDQAVVDDGALISSQGAGTAMALGMALIARLVNAATAQRVATEIVLR